MGKKKNNKNKTNSVQIGTVGPTGLSVSRSGADFTFSWKVADTDYNSGEWVRYQINNGGVTGDIPIIPASMTSFTVTAGAVSRIAFCAKGTRAPYSTSTTTGKGKKKKTVVTNYTPTVSGESWIVWTATPPPAPTLNYSRDSASSGTFTWNVHTSETDRGIFSHVELQTATSRGNNEPGSWSASTRGSSGSVSYTETLNGSNIVRWVRVRSVGPGGASGWVYSYHAYGVPATPTLGAVSASVYSNYSTLIASWSAPFGRINPIDTITVQYVVAVPTNSNLTAPDSGWQDAVEFGGNGGSDKAVANVSTIVDTDQCMWIRLEATHDDSHTYSSAKLAYTGTLAKPGLNATPDSTTGYVTIRTTENTSCNVACTAIFYRSEKRPSYDQIVAILPPGTTETSVYIDEILYTRPDHVENTLFGAWAFVGSYDDLSINALMKSETETDRDIVAVPPAWLELSEASHDDAVRIGWPWSWSAAEEAELSWADHDDAWESTDEPESYIIKNKQITSWVIANLELGRKWFFRARLIGDDDGEDLAGPWSQMYSYDLASIPDLPVLNLSKRMIGADDKVTARWAFTSADGTTQTYADICVATIDTDGNITYGDIVAHTAESQTVEISTDWVTGHNYYLCLRTTSSAGQQSDWSEPVTLYVAEPITLEITEHSLEILGEDLFLTELPLTITAEGAGDAGKTVVSIIRAEDYHIMRPDDSEIDGFEGETIASVTQEGEQQVTITADDLQGHLDDGAKYRLVVTAIDEYGQTITEELAFTVSWLHQAGRPSVEVRADQYQRIAIITPIAPSNYVTGDVCDIYRLSADKPELIVKGAAFGTTYVDPYPAFGQAGGHRLVTRTADGDYITEDNKLAWCKVDSSDGDYFGESAMVINANGEEIELPYNIELQNSWTKDFKRTTYLGGSVQGDWNPAVTRDISANTVILRGRDLDTQIAMRGLAGYAGIAHIRTPDGSSVAADIQVRETWMYDTKRVSYSLTIKVVDPQEPDGVTLAEWTDLHPVD